MRHPRRSSCVLELVEPRRFFSIGASAVVTLASSAPGTGGATEYTYDVALTDTGTGNLQTLWFAWTPGEDYLRSKPSAVTSPTGWTASIEGGNNGSDGSSVLWTSSSSSTAVTPGTTLGGFSFTTVDAPADIAAKSPTHPTVPATTSEVYAAGAPSGVAFEFVATPPDTGGTPPTTMLTAPKVAKSYAFDGAIKLSATLKSGVSKKTAFAGTATIVEGDVTVGTATLSSKGAITFSAKAVAPLDVGDHTLTLVYSGDTAHAAVTSAAFALHVVAAKTTAKLTTSPVKPAAGQSLTLSAQVLAKTAPDVARTGLITFKDGDTVLGTVALDGTSSAAFTIDFLATGTHSFTAVYAGSDNFTNVTTAAKKVTLKVPK